jgi:SAM-dependent methyltransferase
MKKRLLEYLACPSCAGALRLTARREDGIEVMEGELAVMHALGLFSSSAAFRALPIWQSSNATSRQQPRSSVGPGRPSRMRMKNTRLNFWAGSHRLCRHSSPAKSCWKAAAAKGRHTRRVAQWGVRDIVAVDLSAAVEVAFAATRGLENAHVIQADIYRLPLRRAFDYAFSIGVLHHLPDPRGGFKSLVSRVKSEGTCRPGFMAPKTMAGL